MSIFKPEYIPSHMIWWNWIHAYVFLVRLFTIYEQNFTTNRTTVLIAVILLPAVTTPLVFRYVANLSTEVAKMFLNFLLRIKFAVEHHFSSPNLLVCMQRERAPGISELRKSIVIITVSFLVLL